MGLSQTAGGSLARSQLPPFLARAFPDASFVYVFRDPRQAIGGAVAAWRSGQAVTHPGLPEWTGPPWSFPLVPGWRDLRGLPLPEIAARQWQIITRCLLDDLAALPPVPWCVASYDELVQRPRQEVERLCRVLDLPGDGRLAPSLAGQSPAELEAWKGAVAGVDATLPSVAAELERVRDLIARPAKAAPPAGPGSGAELRSVHTTSFPQLLTEIGASLLVSTYQSGRVAGRAGLRPDRECFRAAGRRAGGGPTSAAGLSARECPRP